VVILRRARNSIEIETLLMSCRVLGRGIEEAIFARIADVARAADADEIVGAYIPTKKNMMVAGLYEAHHFLPAPDGTHWIARDYSAFVWPEHVKRLSPRTQVPTKAHSGHEDFRKTGAVRSHTHV
jgi:hypothetical protein